MPLEVVGDIARLRGLVAAARGAGLSIGLVPTMGALHAGHISLIDRARRDCGFVVVSIFVNPLQFDRPDDLERYPRRLAADVEACRSAGVDAVFAPDAAAMYPAPPACRVEVGRLADHLCGRFRPGHFSGVATVVLKLFHIVQPDAAFFGEKDAQQLAIVRRMVADFDLPVRIVGVPTVREPDGLALSSRNERLDADQRRLATALYRALCTARAAVERGVGEAALVKAEAAAAIPADPRVRLEYLEVVDEQDFQPVDRIAAPVIAAGALWVGSTRLIDNLRCIPPAP